MTSPASGASTAPAHRGHRTSTSPSNSSFATAANLDSKINLSSLTALESNLDIATAGQSEFFSVDAPTGSTGTMHGHGAEPGAEPADAEDDGLRLRHGNTSSAPPPAPASTARP